MIEGGLSFVWAAYALALTALAALTIVVVARLAHWSRRARDLERRS